jgi:CDGSH-type Zn-finger protein
MTKWQSKPYLIRVKKNDKIAFCACDQTRSSPYCDGSHRNLETGDLPFIKYFDKDESIYACGCQQSNSRPFCDGSHNDNVGI